MHPPRLTLHGGSLPAWVIGCAADGKLLPTTAAAINAGVAEACPLEAMIPQIGAELVLACPGEEAAVAAALALDTAPTTTAATAVRSLTVQGKRVGVRVVKAPAKVADAGADR